MAATGQYIYPTALELRTVEQVLLPSLIEDDPIFDIFPIVEVDDNRVRWRQKDNFTGLQQIRGLNGAPRRVKRIGISEYDMKPGVYGEFQELEEDEFVERSAFDSWDEPIDISENVGDAQELLLQRRIDRIRYIIWTLLCYGIFSVANAMGTIMHTDQFPLKTLTASTPWSTLATATPLNDIRTAQQLSVGQSVDFGSAATIWMNQVTANQLLNNQNANDFFGKRMNFGQTVNELGDINKILVGNNLPQILVYDRFYIDDNGNAQKFIPTGQAVLIGQRTNKANLGEYRMTRNFVNDRNAPGAYTRVIDTRAFEVPGKFVVHDGHNGGPVLWYPGAICAMTVS
jgi:Phage major capsid protein E